VTLDEWTWHALTRANVEQVPEVGGVYVLGDGRGDPIFYVGQSGTLRTRLAQHLNETENPCISRHVRAGATSFAYKVVLGGEGARVNEEGNLIRAYGPECNR
jgi:excinuclease UvrABC nuclease subunit